MFVYGKGVSWRTNFITDSQSSILSPLAHTLPSEKRNITDNLLNITLAKSQISTSPKRTCKIYETDRSVTVLNHLSRLEQQYQFPLSNLQRTEYKNSRSSKRIQ